MMCESLFTNLSPFASLFEEQLPPWSPLMKIKNYFSQLEIAPIDKIPTGVSINSPAQVWMGPNCVIEPGVVIDGAAFLEAGVTLKSCSYLREGVLVAAGCTIGHGAEVKHSIVLNKAKIAHFCYVGDSIVGQNVQLAAGVKCANLRLDEYEVCCQLNGKKIPTGRRKLGAIIGDGVKIGCNCVISPGTLIGKNVITHPLCHIKGTIAVGSIIKA